MNTLPKPTQQMLAALEIAKANVTAELVIVLYIRNAYPSTAAAAAPLIRGYGRARMVINEQIHALKTSA